MKKILISLLVVITATIISCKKLVELNENNKQPEQAVSGSLFANALKSLVDQETTPSVNFNVFRAFAQYITETTYIDESEYNVLNRKIPDNEFLTMYRDVLKDFKEAQSVVDKETSVISNDIQKKNKKAICEILMVYSFHRLVDVFGNIPYDDALNIENLAPKYDDAKAIYDKLFTRLDAAIANLDVNESSFGSSDKIYNGNVTSWKRFGNSLKVKMAISVADVLELNPGAKISSAIAGGIFTASSQDAKYKYLDAQPNTNPVYVQFIASGRNDWVVANTIVDTMNFLNDPRRDDYFDQNLGAGIYTGGVYGTYNDYYSYTHVSPTVVAPTREAILINYTELQFYLAEAAERGLIGTPADAVTYYNAGITSSILYWGGTAADAADYLLNPNVAYATAPGATYKEKIGLQAWLAFYDRGLLGWTSWRRLDAPMFNYPPGQAVGSQFIPKRFTYPISEQTINGSNYKAAASAIGGDNLTTRLFWDLTNKQ